MILMKLIDVLKHADQDAVVRQGFYNPHSYRGYYNDVAFEPLENVRVADMLLAAKAALGATFTGYKGGDFHMSAYVDCYLAHYGNTGEEIGPTLLEYMLADTVEDV